MATFDIQFINNNINITVTEAVAKQKLKVNAIYTFINEHNDIKKIKDVKNKCGVVFKNGDRITLGEYINLLSAADITRFETILTPVKAVTKVVAKPVEEVVAKPVAKRGRPKKAEPAEPVEPIEVVEKPVAKRGRPKKADQTKNEDIEI